MKVHINGELSNRRSKRELDSLLFSINDYTGLKTQLESRRITMGFVQTDVITCPHCRKKQTLTVYDLTEVDDVEGEFPHYCESCNGKFKVEFEFKCFTKVTPTEVE